MQKKSVNDNKQALFRKYIDKESKEKVGKWWHIFCLMVTAHANVPKLLHAWLYYTTTQTHAIRISSIKYNKKYGNLMRQ